MTLPLLFEILTGKAVASQERAALRLGPWLQVPVKPLSRRSYLGNQRTMRNRHSIGERLHFSDRRLGQKKHEAAQRNAPSSNLLFALPAIHHGRENLGVPYVEHMFGNQAASLYISAGKTRCWLLRFRTRLDGILTHTGGSKTAQLIARTV